MTPDLCLYVALGEGGLFKAGCTGDPRRRQKSLVTEFRLRGDKLLGFHVVSRSPHARDAEHYFLRLLVVDGARVHFGREWFTGVDLSKATKAAFNACRDTAYNNTISKDRSARMCAAASMETLQKLDAWAKGRREVA